MITYNIWKDYKENFWSYRCYDYSEICFNLFLGLVHIILTPITLALDIILSPLYFIAFIVWGIIEKR